MVQYCWFRYMGILSRYKSNYDQTSFLLCPWLRLRHPLRYTGGVEKNSSLPPMVLQVTKLKLRKSKVVPSTLLTLATTITLRGLWTLRLRVGASGTVRRTPRRMPTTCTSVAALLIRRITAVVVTVAPYAAPRSRVDRSSTWDRIPQYPKEL